MVNGLPETPVEMDGKVTFPEQMDEDVGSVIVIDNFNIT